MEKHYFVFENETFARDIESIVATKLTRFHRMLHKPFSTNCLIYAGKTYLVIEVEKTISKNLVRSLVLEAINNIQSASLPS